MTLNDQVLHSNSNDLLTPEIITGISGLGFVIVPRGRFIDKN